MGFLWIVEWSIQLKLQKPRWTMDMNAVRSIFQGASNPHKRRDEQTQLISKGLLWNGHWHDLYNDKLLSSTSLSKVYFMSTTRWGQSRDMVSNTRKDWRKNSHHRDKETKTLKHKETVSTNILWATQIQCWRKPGIKCFLERVWAGLRIKGTILGKSMRWQS